MIIENIIVILGVFAIALIFAPIGLGGGMLFVPLIHYVSGWPIDGKLIAISLMLTGVVSWGSGLTHRKENLVDDDLIGVSLWSAIPGAVIGVIVIQLIENDYETIFKFLSLILISFALTKMILKINDKTIISNQGGEENLRGVIIGTGIGGFLSSVLAIGAGAIYVPTLKIFGKLKTRVSIGSSLNIMMIVVPIAALCHILILSKSQSSELFEQLPFILIILIITFFGSKLGAQIGIKYIDEQKIMYIFISVLIIIWFRYILDILS